MTCLKPLFLRRLLRLRRRSSLGHHRLDSSSSLDRLPRCRFSLAHYRKVLAIRLEAESVIRLGIDEVREFAKKIVRFVVGQDSVGRFVQADPNPMFFFWDCSSPTVLCGWPRLVGAMREEISTSCTYCALTPPRSVLHLLPRLGEASRLINKGSIVELMANRTSPSG
nr:hypothetical protein Iba_chr02eCG11720 [Ipomoea batatas]GMD81096.1 hypothetical protein Iba_chr13eCG8270 [Ipomoea batatas]